MRFNKIQFTKAATLAVALVFFSSRALAQVNPAAPQPAQTPQPAQPAAPADSTPATLALTLQQAQEMALQHSTAILNANLEVQKAEASRWQAIASMLPQVSASVDYSTNFGYQIDLGGMKISMPPSATFGITTAMAFSGAQVVSIQMANISRRMADLSLHKNDKEIADQAKLLYYSALVTDETVKLLEENLESLKKLYEYSASSVRVGITEQTDADQLLVQVNTMANTISSSKRQLEMIYNSIRLLLNVDVDTEIVLLQGLDNLVNQESTGELLAEKFDVEENYDFRLLKESTELARKQVALTGWSGGPTLSVFHQYNEKKYFSDDVTMNMTPPNMLGVQLNIPLFTSWKQGSAVKAARMTYKEQLNTLENTRLALNIQHRQLVYNLTSAMERYDTQKQSVEVARRVFDNIAKKYEYGLSSSLDLTNAGTSLITAQSNYVQALLEMVNAQISLEQLLNK
jgi:outer membrane protein TolC